MMTEPTRAELVESLRWRKLPVLDEGFVCLVDVMGDDAAVVQAARVSYGEGTKRVSDDRTLIRYLMRHRHSTPFEMAEVKLLVRVPMDCWRQWIRTRTACLSGDAQLSFDRPGAEKRNRRQRHSVTMADFHRMWHEGTQSTFSAKKKPTFAERVDPFTVYTIPELSRLVERREEDLRTMVRDGRLTGERVQNRILVRGAHYHEWAGRSQTRTVPIRERLQKMTLRMCDEVTGEIRHTHVTDIWCTGPRPVFRVTLENGYQLKMTRDHRCLTTAGWQTLQEATSLRLRDDGGCTWDGNVPAFAVNGVSVAVYQDREWLAEQRDAGLSVSQIAEAAGVSYHTVRKYLQKFDLRYSSSEKARLSGNSQRGQRRTCRPRGPLTGAALENVREARSGERSNFWKGGVSTERAKIGRWTTDQAQRVHALNGYRCVVCGSKQDLETHHVDPVWNNADRAYDLSNLTSLCYQCHSWVHQGNLELRLLEAVQADDLLGFWEKNPHPESRPAKKRKPAVRRLKRAWSKVARVEYVGEETTYDLSVSGPYHNFVANGFVVHNSVNEYSTRYSLAIDAAQATPADQWRSQAESNRQGSGDFLPVEVGEPLSAAERQLQEQARAVYQERLDRGVAREQARKDLPLSTYTEAYWKIDLHNLLHFLSLRMDAHAQLEIREFATVIGEQIVRPLFPAVWEAFADYRLGSLFLTRLDLETVARLSAAAAQLRKSPPFPEELFLACQDASWKDLARCRERDECREKLVRLGLLHG